MSDLELTSRAFTAYFRELRRVGAIPIQPSNASGVEEIDGLLYVHLFNSQGTLAVYRVITKDVGGRPEQRLKKLRRWPKRFQEESTNA